MITCYSNFLDLIFIKKIHIQNCITPSWTNHLLMWNLQSSNSFSLLFTLYNDTSFFLFAKCFFHPFQNFVFLKHVFVSTTLLGFSPFFQFDSLSLLYGVSSSMTCNVITIYLILYLSFFSLIHLLNFS